MTQELEWFWLCSIPGFYRRDLAALLEIFQTPQRIRHMQARELEKLTFLKEKQRRSLREHQKSFDMQETYHKNRERGISFISCEDEAYPRRLRQIEDYPFGLFVKGTHLPPTGRTVAIVGARMCTNYGRAMAMKLAEKLAGCGVSVISGMAYGVDGVAQAACLKAGGRSFGVLGCGVDLCYPREHRGLYEQMQRQGCVISEYPPGTQALSSHFPPRNRIISGLAETIVVVEAKKKSGSLITADMALEQGRDVYAFPGRIDDPLSAGCNALIAQGAGIVTEIDSFLESLGFLPTKKRKKRTNIVLATAEELVYSCLDSRALNLQEIMGSVDLPAQQVMSAVTSLQMHDLIEETAKNYYVRK
ncbi:MAG: DNA-processing protein DprA [Eubacteriales bacterium]|nr:DNA-processing protein DprA [Eubacteriales bacterium]